MLWRVRTTLPDRPGALAVLARNCGDAQVNILGLQVFPGVDSVTDELVLRTPEDWRLADLARLVERSGGQAVSAMPCTEHALVDFRLYLPKEWAKDRQRRKKAGVPKDLRFRTRHELALQMLDEAAKRY